MPRPNESDLLSAIQSVWLCMRHSVAPSRFRTYLRGRERACILRSFRELEGIWQAYATSLATDEARAEARKTARMYRGWQETVAAMTLPAAITTYDPTLKGDDPFNWYVDPPVPGVLDRNFFWDEASAYRAITDDSLHAKLLAAGWQLPAPLTTTTKTTEGTPKAP